MDKTSRAARYLSWVAYLEKQSISMVSYLCPHCEYEIKTMTSPEGEKWDSFTQCPFCSCSYFKIVIGSTVTTKLINQESCYGKAKAH